MHEVSPQFQLEALAGALAQLRDGERRIAEFSHTARSQTVLLGALPPRYTQVLHDLLDRLESSALFAEESCSFSHGDLLDSVSVWVDKAREHIAQARASRP